MTDVVSDRISLAYFGSKPDIVIRSHSKDGLLEEYQMNINISQLAKPIAAFIGIVVMLGNIYNTNT